MIRNLGSIDRMFRIGAGMAIIGLSIAGKIGPWGYLGIVPLLTGSVGTCPIYAVFGFRTCANAGSQDQRDSPCACPQRVHHVEDHRCPGPVGRRGALARVERAGDVGNPGLIRRGRPRRKH